jgi:hypothetical protein
VLADLEGRLTAVLSPAGLQMLKQSLKGVMDL